MSMFRYSGNGSMRYNAKELAFIAIQPAKFFTKEGPLYMRTTQGNHVWNRKKDVYNERWCRLRGNLLFYFKGRDLLSEPQGVIVLEQCFIKEEYAEIQPFAFCIEFVGEEHNQYFAAHSAELRDEWVAILQKGSYESLRSQFHSLRAQLLARTGQDPIDEERHGVVGKHDSMVASSGEPILEMSITCTDLPKNTHGVAPSTFVSISCVTPPDTRWSKSGQTEIIDQNSNPFFLTTVAFETSRNISPITRLRANIYEVQDRNIHKTSGDCNSSVSFSHRSTFSVNRSKSPSPSLEAIHEQAPIPPPRRHRGSNGAIKSLSISPRNSDIPNLSASSTSVSYRKPSSPSSLSVNNQTNRSTISDIPNLSASSASVSYRKPSSPSSLSVNNQTNRSTISDIPNLSPSSSSVSYRKPSSPSSLSVNNQMNHSTNSDIPNMSSSSTSVSYRKSSSPLSLSVPKPSQRPASEIITSSSSFHTPSSAHFDNTQIVPIGQVICSFREIVTSPENRLVMDIIGTDGSRSGGTITLLLWELEQNDMSRPTSVIKPENPLKNMLGHGPPPAAVPRRNRSMSLSRDNYFRALYCSPCTKTYRYPDVDGTHVLVQEIMVESRLSFAIPQQMIEMFLQEEKKKLEELSMFGELSRDWEEVRSAIMSEHINLTVRYKESLEHLNKHTKGPQFKRSVDKGERLLEFVPTNLHLQRMRVEKPGHQEKMYDVVTVGAPAGHSMKFKHGGLRKILQQYSEEQNKSAIGSFSQSSLAAEHLAKMADLKRQLDWCCSDLMTAAKHFTVETMESKAQTLADKVNEVISVCEAPFMEDMYNEYRVAQTNGKPPPRNRTAKSIKHHSRDDPQSHHEGDGHSSSSSSVSAGGGTNNRKSTISNPSSNHVELREGDYEDWEWNGVNFVRSTDNNSMSSGQGNTTVTWRGMCEKLRDHMNIIVQVIEMLPPGASVRERYGAVEPGVKNLKESIKHLEDQARYSVGFYRMQEEHKHMTLLQNLQCRRDVVLSQAISALIAGVITKVRSNLHNVGFLNQACRIGILVDFESLLSTYVCASGINLLDNDYGKLRAMGYSVYLTKNTLSVMSSTGSHLYGNSGEEMGMIEDMTVGINDLQFVNFKFAENRNPNADLVPVIGGTRSNIIITVPLPQTLYKELPMEFHKSGGPTIRVHPVMFSVGMNEEQSLAELFGDTSLQDFINRESLQKLELYYEQFIRNVPADDRIPSDSSLSLDVLMSSLKHKIASRRNKNMEILHVSAQLVRRMNGVRVTSCKSAKDRTAMSVTLEQCQILQDEHQINAEMFTRLLDTMRSEGTRRDNTRKNVGINKYAFNKMQIRAFPKLYRPPEGTYGKTVIT